jgi:hypothetical protein
MCDYIVCFMMFCMIMRGNEMYDMYTVADLLIIQLLIPMYVQTIYINRKTNKEKKNKKKIQRRFIHFVIITHTIIILTSHEVFQLKLPKLLEM